jgi:hypothetical protein
MGKSHHEEKKDETFEDYKEFLILKKLRWLLISQKEVIQSGSLLNKVLSKFTNELEFPDKPKLDYENLSDSQKQKRVVLALEKLNSVNKDLFTPNEQKILTPTRIGVLQKTYFFGVHFTNLAWVLHTLFSKNFCKKNIGFLTLFTFANFSFLQGLPLYVKESFRFRKSQVVAGKYLSLENGKMERFVKVLNPFVDHHYLEHFHFTK